MCGTVLCKKKQRKPVYEFFFTDGYSKWVELTDTPSVYGLPVKQNGEIRIFHRKVEAKCGGPIRYTYYEQEHKRLLLR